ncbi:MAG TPA: DUF4175 family protein, partial [Isosphaeraceae bacterium]|nr:DUF4175 family protein [Isosphaeraceae bacterium]
MARKTLESRIAALRGRVRRLLALHGMSWVVGGLVLAVVAACLADWLVHLAPEVRLVALLAVLGLGGWLTARFVVAPLVVRFRDLDIAMRIERRWPGLNDRLASTVQFLRSKGDDSHLGSRAMREATIEQTLQETDTIDFREVVDPLPARRAFGLAGTSLVLALLFVVVAPGLSQIALQRLFRPFGAARWPQQTHLTVIEAARKVARGEPFSLAVAVAKGESMPASARVTYRFDNGETATEALRPVDGGVFRGRIETVSRTFSFSVAAGDDSTGWREVLVVAPPVLQDVKITLTPPAYTAEAPSVLAPGRTQIRAVEGTVVDVVASANKPIASAVLHRGESSGKEPVTIASSGKRLSTHFVVADSDPFWFALKDTEGFRNQEAVRYEVRSIRDEAPRVVIDEPDSDRDVPPEARVPVQITIDDDYGLQSARLLHRVASAGSEPTSEVSEPLWEAEVKPGPGVTLPRHQEI